MALAISSVKTFAEGNHKVKTFQLAWDSSYLSGGETLTAATLGLYTITDFKIDSTSGFVFKYDYTNSVVKAYTVCNTYTATVDPASMLTDTVANTDVTITGAVTTDIVEVIPPNTLEAGIVVQQAWVTATNTVRLRLCNTSSGTVDPASATWTFNLRNASGALKEVKSTYDLSAVTGVRAKVQGF